MLLANVNGFVFHFLQLKYITWVTQNHLERWIKLKSKTALYLGNCDTFMRWGIIIPRNSNAL